MEFSLAFGRKKRLPENAFSEPEFKFVARDNRRIILLLDSSSGRNGQTGSWPVVARATYRLLEELQESKDYDRVELGLVEFAGGIEKTERITSVRLLDINSKSFISRYPSRNSSDPTERTRKRDPIFEQMIAGGTRVHGIQLGQQVNGLLKDLATKSGGRFSAVDDPDDDAGAFMELLSFYESVFQINNPSKLMHKVFRPTKPYDVMSGSFYVDSSINQGLLFVAHYPSNEAPSSVRVRSPTGQVYDRVLLPKVPYVADVIRVETHIEMVDPFDFPKERVSDPSSSDKKHIAIEMTMTIKLRNHGQFYWITILMNSLGQESGNTPDFGMRQCRKGMPLDSFKVAVAAALPAWLGVPGVLMVAYLTVMLVLVSHGRRGGDGRRRRKGKEGRASAGREEGSRWPLMKEGIFVVEGNPGSDLVFPFLSISLTRAVPVLWVGKMTHFGARVPRYSWHGQG
ncbi:unnamed protein product, partial [Notodromas monacha]